MGKRQSRTYKSMNEFRKRFLPNSLRKQRMESMDRPSLVASLVDESLSKIMAQLRK